MIDYAKFNAALDSQIQSIWDTLADELQDIDHDTIFYDLETHAQVIIAYDNRINLAKKLVEIIESQKMKAPAKDNEGEYEKEAV